MEFNGIYPLVTTHIAIENGPVEIVCFRMKHGDFPVRYVVVYQMVSRRENE